MPQAKSKKSQLSVTSFLKSLPDDQKRKDCNVLIDLMKKTSNAEPRMCGTSIIGFGKYHYKFANGRTGEAPIVGLSPRKQNLTLYIMPGFGELQDLLKKLGKHTGQSCLYFKRLDDIDLPTLKMIIVQSIAKMKASAA